MTGGLDKVDASMYPVILQFVSVNSVLLFQVVVKPRLDVIDDRFPARYRQSRRRVSFRVHCFIDVS